jgi:hypothetical protein
MYLEHFYTQTRMISFQNRLVVILFLVACTLFSQRLFAQNVAQVVNLSATFQAFDVYVGSEKVIDDFLPFSNAKLVEFPSNISTSVVIAPATSLGPQEGLAQFDLVLDESQQYILAVFDQETGGQLLPKLATIQKDDAFTGDPLKAGVAFSHLIPNGPNMNVLLRSGGMIVGNLPFGQTTYDIELPTEDNFLDLKAQGTTDILGTYRLSLQGLASTITYVFIVGATQNTNTPKLYSLTTDGWLFPVDAAPVSRVQFINALPETIDIYKNGTRFADNAAYGSAMAYKYIPAGIVMKIDICDDASTTASNPWGTKNYTFQNMVNYTAIAAGPPNAPSMFLHHGSREVAIDTGTVEFLFFNGLSSSPLVSVWNDADDLVFENIGFGTYSNYVACVGEEEIFTIRDGMSGDLIGHFRMTNLVELKGQSITLVLAPNPSSQVPECWAAKANGSVLSLASVALDLTDAFANNSIYLAPNPTSENTMNILNKNEKLFGQDCTYTIIGMDGRSWQHGSIVLAEKNTIPIHLIPSGTYIIQLIQNGSSTNNLRFLKW